MQYLDLTKQYKSIKKEIDQAIKNILNKSHFILGAEVKEFEKQVAKHCKTKYAIGVNSGTDALLLSLMALNIGQGDEVITTPFTFISTAEVIALCKAKPVFVDIDPETFNIDADKIEKVITKKTKAIIPVHLFGQSAEMDKIMKIARKYKLKIIEDAAQSIGAKYKGKITGTIGDTGCLSFFPSKNLGGFGDGGMVITNNKNLADKIRILRAHGSKIKYYHHYLGINSRLDALQAAILKVKLKYLNKWSQQRRKNAQYYNTQLKNIKGVVVPKTISKNIHVFNQYTIRVKQRNQLQKYLKQYDIPTQIYYPLCLHLQPIFKSLGYKKNSLPNSEKASQEVLSLPIYPGLPKKDQNFIIKKIKEFYEKK